MSLFGTIKGQSFDFFVGGEPKRSWVVVVQAKHASKHSHIIAKGFDTAGMFGATIMMMRKRSVMVVIVVVVVAPMLFVVKQNRPMNEFLHMLCQYFGLFTSFENATRTVVASSFSNIIRIVILMMTGSNIRVIVSVDERTFLDHPGGAMGGWWTFWLLYGERNRQFHRRECRVYSLYLQRVVDS